MMAHKPIIRYWWILLFWLVLWSYVLIEERPYAIHYPDLNCQHFLNQNLKNVLQNICAFRLWRPACPVARGILCLHPQGASGSLCRHRCLELSFPDSCLEVSSSPGLWYGMLLKTWMKSFLLLLHLNYFTLSAALFVYLLFSRIS